MSRAVLAVVWLGSAGVVWAGPPRAPDDWRVWAEAYTDVPTQVAAAVEVVAPFGVRLRAGAGWMPSDYVALANQVAVQFDGYTAAQGDAVVAALRDSVVWSVETGWRPDPSGGFAFGLGYQLLTLGGEATSEALLAIATGAEPDAERDASWTYGLDVTVHRLRVGVSWTWWLGAEERLALSARVGGEFTLASSSDIQPEQRGFGLAHAERFAREAEAQLDDILQTNLHYPTVGLALAYRID